MSVEVARCRITVLKRNFYRDLAAEYLDDSCKDVGPCGLFEEGQEFEIDPAAPPPEGFCLWAWADIRRDMLAVAYGADVPGLKQRGTVLSGCTDWLRPVIFKIERLG
jgi:uncharacterized repeat protein (TIGR04076 family)